MNKLRRLVIPLVSSIALCGNMNVDQEKMQEMQAKEQEMKAKEQEMQTQIQEMQVQIQKLEAQIQETQEPYEYEYFHAKKRTDSGTLVLTKEFELELREGDSVKYSIPVPIKDYTKLILKYYEDNYVLGLLGSEPIRNWKNVKARFLGNDYLYLRIGEIGIGAIYKYSSNELIFINYVLNEEYRYNQCLEYIDIEGVYHIEETQPIQKEGYWMLPPNEETYVSPMSISGYEKIVTTEIINGYKNNWWLIRAYKENENIFDVFLADSKQDKLYKVFENATYVLEYRVPQTNNVDIFVVSKNGKAYYIEKQINDNKYYTGQTEFKPYATNIVPIEFYPESDLSNVSLLSYRKN